MELKGTQQLGTEISHAAMQEKKERAPRNQVKPHIVRESEWTPRHILLTM